MSRTWDDLQDGKLGEFTIPITTRRLMGSRDMQRTKQPYRPGQTVTDTGRNPKRISLEIPLFEGMGPYNDAGDHYWPELYEELLFLFDDDEQKGEVDYIDPELGFFSVKIVSYEATAEAQRRDGLVLKVELEEIGTDPSAFRFALAETASPRGTAQALALDVDEDLATAGVATADLDSAFSVVGFPRVGPEALWPDGQIFEYMAEAYFANLEAGVLGVQEVGNLVDRERFRIGQVMQNPIFLLDENWFLRTKLDRLSGFFAQESQRKLNTERKVSTIITSGVTTVWDLAAEFYGDSSRADEILTLNLIENPLLIPAGLTIRVYST